MGTIAEALVPSILAGAAVFQDLNTGLIRNWLTVPFLVAALTRAAVTGGAGTLVSSFFAGLTAFWAIYRFSTPGGGDLKLSLAVGAWYGFRAWPIFVGGALFCRVVLSLAVKLKVYTPSAFFQGLWTELVTGIVPALGDRNFPAFQNAGRLAGVTNDVPVVPGALWVFGGTVAVLFFEAAGLAV